MVATIRRQRHSPFWSLRYRDLDTGKWREKSTGLRTDSVADTRKAQRLAEKTSADEQRIGSPGDSPAFNAWVPGFLAEHWRLKAQESTRRYRTAWQAIKLFLSSEGIVYPRQIKYAHGEAYLRWRMASKVHGRKVGHNTALLELKFLSQLINESIRREYAEANPIARLGIARSAPAVKPELSDEDIKKLRAALSGEPEWMRTCFEIALYTGCRFSECSIPMTDIDLAAGTIRLRDAKRGENDPRKYFTVPIHPALRPLLTRLHQSGSNRTVVLSRDKNGRINHLFKSVVDASFHSLRVTFVTRLHRSGTSSELAMALVNHSSQLVHQIYSRLNVEDKRKALAKIQLP